MDIIKQFNWIDIVVVILLMRMGYIALKNGLPSELFKFLGTVSSIYLSLHYYSSWSAILKERTLKNMPLEFLNFFSFLVLVFLGYLIFVILRKLVLKLITVEPVEKLNQWGGFVLGIIRAGLMISLLIFILVISNINYLKNSVEDSYLGKRIFNIAPTTYAVLWNNLASKFMTDEAFNKNIPDIVSSFESQQD